MNGINGEVLGKGKTVGGLGVLTVATFFSQRASAKGVEGLTPEILMAFGAQVVGAITVIYGLAAKILRAKDDRETAVWKAIRKLETPPRT